MTSAPISRQWRAAIAAAALCATAAGAAAAPAADVSITRAWARPTVPGQPVGAAYFDVRSAEGATLTGLRTDAADSVELHAMHRDRDIMRMRELTSLSLPAGQVVHLAPGDTHAMLVHLKRPLKAGESISLELLLVDASGRRQTLHIRVPISTEAPESRP